MTELDTMLEHYLAEWGLSKPEPLAVTVTSHVYTVTSGSDTVVLKVLHPGEVEERQGALALQHFDGRGAVRLLRSDDGAQLLEYADGEDLTGLVASGQDEAATAIIGGVINTLHSNDVIPPQGMVTLRRWFKALFDQAERDRGQGSDTIFIRAASRADSVLSHPHNQRVLHGDIHHENIRRSPRGWLAFDPKGVYGERTYDLANTMCNPDPRYGVAIADEARILRSAEILARTCRIAQERVLLFLYLYACLSASWTLEGEDPGDVSDIIAIAGIAERHI